MGWSLVGSRSFAVRPTDMIWRPSGVTATQFSPELFVSSSRIPCAPGILSRSWPSAIRQTKSVRVPPVPATSRLPSGENARHRTPCPSALERIAQTVCSREFVHGNSRLHDSPQADDVAARNGKQAAIGGESDIADRFLAHFLAVQEPVATQVVKRESTAVFAPEQFGTVGRVRNRLDPDFMLCRQNDLLDLPAGTYVENRNRRAEGASTTSSDESTVGRKRERSDMVQRPQVVRSDPNQCPRWQRVCHRGKLGAPAVKGACAWDCTA